MNQWPEWSRSAPTEMNERVALCFVRAVTGLLSEQDPDSDTPATKRKRGRPRTPWHDYVVPAVQELRQAG